MTLVEILKSCNFTHPFQLIGKILVVSLDETAYTIECTSVQHMYEARHPIIFHFHPLRLKDNSVISDRLVYDPQSNEWLVLGNLELQLTSPVCTTVQVETLESYLQNADDFTK